MRTQAVRQHYLATQVATADRLQLVVMLYEGAIGFLEQAKEGMAAQDAARKGRYLGKALDILAELSASLNFSESRELASQLFQLYTFMTQHLTRANLNWDIKAVEQVIAMLTTLKDAWQNVCQQARKGELDEVPEGKVLQGNSALGSLRV